MSNLDQLDPLVSPFGVVSNVSRLRPVKGLPELHMHVANIGTGYPGHGGARPSPHADVLIAGSKAIGDRRLGRMIAIAEGAERYAAFDMNRGTDVCASYDELTEPALDPARIARCSETELADRRCPLGTIDRGTRVRWTKGTDLATGTDVWLPAVMASYRLRDVTREESFWFRISTGFAVHTDPYEALLRGACEVIERDMIALTWLQRLPLPRVDVAHLSAGTRSLVEWCEQHFLDTCLFDATSDLGVPTVLCLQAAPHSIGRMHVLGAATGRVIDDAAISALLEALNAGGRGMAEDRQAGAKTRAMSQGADYMAHADRASAFDFLIDGTANRSAPPPPRLPERPFDALAVVVNSIHRAGMQAIAVDATSNELAAIGLTAVNVVIPELQPMSLIPRAQYRGHPRLYDGPRRMNYPSRLEEELNPWPVPFA
ncbi:MAG TPA: YcaO-like family protein [Micromonosporaceae bacterium]|jgi:ribosomal protein S12 methylthiotransferase accessory factor